jgi:hypothetical protein
MNPLSTIRNILFLVPEAAPMVKQASVDEEFPLDTRDDAIMSALKVEYMLKVAHEPVYQDDYDRIHLAVALYQAGDIVKQASQAMLSNIGALTKQASSDEVLVKQAEEAIEGSLCGLRPDMDAITAAARHLVSTRGDLVKSATVRRLGGGDDFVRDYAVASLVHREAVTPGYGYGEIAEALTKMASVSKDHACQISDTVRHLDDTTGLRLQGYDLYAEAWVTKQAMASSMLIKLAGRDVPIESILRLPIDRILGDDVALACHSHPAEAKAVLESLPLPQQSLLLSRI